MNTKQKIGRACMIVGILLILGALALLGYNQWDANRADKASQDALGKLEETLTETIEDKTKDEEPVVQPELDPEQEMTVTDIDKMITATDEDAWDLTLFTCTTGGRARCAVRCTRTGYPVLETSAAGRITE